ncbi:MAG: O-antigen ligase family protein [Phycisphaerales bacterium]|nr:MAG: O-antigen ligase family protein [Phycisphaerales bacterium]
MNEREMGVTDGGGASRAVATVSCMVVCVMVLAKMVATREVMPYWSEDPLLVPAFSAGVTPAISLTMDVVSLVASSVLLFSMRRANVAGLVCLVCCAILGLAPAGVHAFSPRFNLENLVMFSNWSAAFFGAIALHAASRDSRLHRLASAVLLAVVGMLIAKGAMQFFVDHPQTMAEFERNRERILDSHGWSKDSVNARLFERRLLQREATGWFGLSNVYASVLAAACGAWLGAFVCAERERRENAARPIMATMLGMGACAFGLALSMSKGGMVAACVGAVFAVLPRVLDRLTARPSALGWLVRDEVRRAGVLGTVYVLVPLVVIAMVVVRGVIGTRVGELSVLFRWFYIKASCRMLVDHPWRGVGSDAFQAMYQIVKDPRSPESVTSPHSMFFEYVATLGIAGCALVAVVLVLAGRAGAALGSKKSGDDGPTDPSDRRTEVYTIVLVLLAVSGFSHTIAAVIGDPAGASQNVIATVAGLVLAIAMSLVVLRWSVPARVVAMAAGCAALLAHGQIELTPTNLSSGAWVMAMLGVAGAGRALCGRGVGGEARHAAVNSRRRWSMLVPGVAALVPVVVVGTRLESVWRWEGALASAAKRLDLLPVVDSLGQAASEATSAQERQRAQQDLRAVLEPEGLRPDDREHFIESYAAWRQGKMKLAAEDLGRATRIMTTHAETWHALSGLLVHSASDAVAMGDERTAIEKFLFAGDAARRAVDVRGRAGDWVWLSTVNRSEAELKIGDSRTSLALALEALDHARVLDPYALSPVVQAIEVAGKMGDAARQRDLAREALRLDGLMGLDREAGLTKEQRGMFERLSREGDAGLSRDDHAP